jgi:hypothetical protein
MVIPEMRLAESQRTETAVNLHAEFEFETQFETPMMKLRKLLLIRQ